MEHCEEGYIDMSHKDKETESTGQDICEGSMMGTKMEALGESFLAKVAQLRYPYNCVNKRISAPLLQRYT